jgi:hypothetical protein
MMPAPIDEERVNPAIIPLSWKTPIHGRMICIHFPGTIFEHRATPEHPGYGEGMLYITFHDWERGRFKYGVRHLADAPESHHLAAVL